MKHFLPSIDFRNFLLFSGMFNSSFGTLKTFPFEHLRAKHTAPVQAKQHFIIVSVCLIGRWLVRPIIRHTRLLWRLTTQPTNQQRGERCENEKSGAARRQIRSLKWETLIKDYVIMLMWACLLLILWMWGEDVFVLLNSTFKLAPLTWCSSAYGNVHFNNFV